MQPYFYTLQEFLAMGKHGIYVWSCWGLTVAVIVAFILYSRQQRQRTLKQLRIQQARKQHTRNQVKRPKTSVSK
ncbi:heme exporter protein CcmD [Psychrobacter sp. I-STPA10]|uniref:heme exporter protein CcmD n=1 Tax=Psychrobacter sp. I-STPA10 TaxID=2585769 RepID=UPI001E5F83EC|nr:heme exporter protein CcmD [Psychrobacter sp. I-STPA10]